MTKRIASGRLISCSCSSCSLTSSTSSPFWYFFLVFDFWCRWVPHIRIFFLLSRIILSNAAWFMNKYLMINNWLIKWWRILWKNILTLVLIKKAILFLLVVLKRHFSTKMTNHSLNPLFFRWLINIISLTSKATKWAMIWNSMVSDSPPTCLHFRAFNSILTWDVWCWLWY